jgi:hypothetical protein
MNNINSVSETLTLSFSFFTHVIIQRLYHIYITTYCRLLNNDCQLNTLNGKACSILRWSDSSWYILVHFNLTHLWHLSFKCKYRVMSKGILKELGERWKKVGNGPVSEFSHHFIKCHYDTTFLKSLTSMTTIRWKKAGQLQLQLGIFKSPLSPELKKHITYSLHNSYTYHWHFVISMHNIKIHKMAYLKVFNSWVI